ncbi:partial Linear gramicidin synthase subunit D, partial [Anaerolineae bacterium]
PALDHAFVPPRTPQEKILADLWAEVLRREPIGVHDNFLELGGDSILSIQILTKARERNLNFTLQQLFQHPTIAELVTKLGSSTAGTMITEKVEPFSMLSSEDLAKIQALR